MFSSSGKSASQLCSALKAERVVSANRTAPTAQHGSILLVVFAGLSQVVAPVVVNDDDDGKHLEGLPVWDRPSMHMHLVVWCFGGQERALHRRCTEAPAAFRNYFLRILPAWDYVELSAHGY